MAAGAAGQPPTSETEPAAEGKPVAAGDGERSGSRRLASPGLAFSFLHLAVLSTFALAQPLFDLLKNNPEFFAARGSTPSEVIVFAVLVVVLPPAVLLAVEAIVGLISKRARLILHLVLLALLAALIFVQALKGALESSDLLLIAICLGLGGLGAFLYGRAEPVRSFLSVLSPAPIVFLALFLLSPGISKVAFPDEAAAQSAAGIKRVPVVMVVMDEFPSGSLLDEKGRVDRVRYPGFAKLAADGTWFRNAHSIYDSTSKAVPAIMDGDYPEKGTLPTASDHPNSIFSLLGESHRMNVSEEATTVCSRELCNDDRLDSPFLDRIGSITDDLSLVYAHVVAPSGMEKDLPSVSETWGDFGGGGEAGATGGGAEVGAEPDEAATRAQGKRRTLANLRGGRTERYQQWLDRIDAGGGKPGLNFKHILLPHVPWQYLPDGRLYSEGTDPIAGLSRQAYRDENAVNQQNMRHLLQVGFADLQIRRLIDKLEREGVYDDALVVVTADHGVSFRRGEFDRRKVDSRNISEISPVPLFIKRPGQRRGQVDDAIVETTDIMPTIADVLGAKLPARTDGRSAFGAEVGKRTEVKMLERDLDGWIRLPEQRFEQLRADVLREKIELFGEGADGPDRIFEAGPNRQLIGRKVQSLQAGRSETRARLTDPSAFADVDPEGALLPSWVTGKLSGSEPIDLAIAVNGRIVTVSRSFELATGGGQIFGSVIPESALRRGRNRVEVFEVDGSSLRRVAGA